MFYLHTPANRLIYYHQITIHQLLHIIICGLGMSVVMWWVMFDVGDTSYTMEMNLAMKIIRSWLSHRKNAGRNGCGVDPHIEIWIWGPIWAHRILLVKKTWRLMLLQYWKCNIWYFDDTFIRPRKVRPRKVRSSKGRSGKVRSRKASAKVSRASVS